MPPGLFTIGLAQCRHPEDGDAVGLVRRWAETAAGQGVGLLVFPESLMTRYDEDRACFLAAAEPLDGPFSQSVRAAAAEHGLWCVFTINERGPGKLPFNTAVVSDSMGRCRGSYRKVHLFDAQSHRESGRMAAGNALFAPLATPFGALGLGICYDLRFPEMARAAAVAGAQVMLYPAAWVDGPAKTDQWQTLLRARAIENGMYVAGCCRCDEGYVGASCVFAPDGSIVGEAGRGEELLCCAIDLGHVNAVRQATPSLLHRRPDLY